MKTTKIPKSLKNIDLNAVLRKRGIYKKRDINAKLKKEATPLAKQIYDSKKKPVKKTKADEPQTYRSFTNLEVNDYYGKQIHLIHIVEDKFKNKLTQFIEKIMQGYLNHLETEYATKKSISLFKDFFSDNEDDFEAQAQIDFTPLLNSVSTLAGQKALDLVIQNQVYIGADMKKQIEQNVAKFTKSMLETDQAQLSKILEQGIASGQSMAEIRNTIQADFSEYNKMQSNRITLTEVTRASVQSQIDAYQQSGVVEGLQWVTDGDPCPECEPLDGTEIALTDNFYGIDNEFQDGDPPLHPNCECSVIPIVIND